MDQSDPINSSNTFIDLQPRSLMQVGLLGLALGAAAWVATALIRQIVFVPLFCGDPVNSLCVNATDNAGTVALIFATIAGLMGLVRLGIYRPLLVALAAAIVLWGLAGWTDTLSWVESLLWSVFLFTISYVAFTWLVRPRSFPVALAAVIIVVALARVLPVLLQAA